MLKTSNLRSVIPSDLAKLKVVLDQTELFPSDLLEGMLASFWHDPQCNDLWLTYVHDDAPVALLFCQQERMTAGTWNVLALAVLPSFQKLGIGRLLMLEVEKQLQAHSQSTLIVETSGLSDYEGAQAFYERIGFCREAVVRDFYAQGEDKVIFWKSLGD